MTQQKQKGPNFPTWGKLAAEQGCFTQELAPPRGHRGPILVLGWDGERWQPGFTAARLQAMVERLVGSKTTSASSPVEEENRQGQAVTCRPPWLSGAGSDAGHLAQGVTPPSSPTWPRPGALEGVGLVWPLRWGKRLWFGSKSPGWWRRDRSSLLGPTVAAGGFQLSLSASREGSTTFQEPRKDV